MQQEVSIKKDMTKKKIIIVNNNLKIGGIQKALINLLHEISNQYDVTLYLLNAAGEFLDKVPQNVRVIGGTSLYKYFGMSQAESKKRFIDYFCRTFFAITTKIFGRGLTTNIISAFSKKLPEEYDCAISYMHEAGKYSFYGGCNSFVISKVRAKKKISFLHCDYGNSGSNYKSNNALYEKFDKIAACSEGCKKSFVKVLPCFESKTCTVVNCHHFEDIISLSKENTVIYDKECINSIIVARLNQEKGIERAIYAIKYALDRGVKVKLHIVGNGILMESLSELCKGLSIENNVTFYGEQTNPYRYIKNADFLFIPSLHEAAPLVIDEAICLGVPVFSAETTSSEDMITERKCGWVCGNSQEEINIKLYELLSNREEIEKKADVLNRIVFDNSLALKEFEKIVN